VHNAWLHRLTPPRLLAVSVAVALLTIGLKTAAWWVTGSIGLLSDALESLVNLAGATFGLLMVTVAARPPDEEHPFGHDKAEYFSSGFEGILIVAAALAILWVAIGRLWHPQALEQLGWGLGLSVLSAVCNGALAWVMLKAARLHRSVALEGDARHLLTDVWTSAGVVLGLVLAAVTGWLWLDAVVAIGVALHILREGVRLVWASSQGLMDRAVDADVQARILAVLDRFATAEAASSTVRFDHLYTRQAGQRCFVAVHLHLPADWSLGQAAAYRAEVEQALMTAVPGLRATIELLPLGVEALAEPGRG
jgi:cation diffusion facilitator family transporter